MVEIERATDEEERKRKKRRGGGLNEANYTK